mgnify:CR=1 FL=1
MVATSSPKLILPTEATAPTKRWGEMRFLMMGQAGCGKSTFWANDANALFIDTEGNLSHLGVKKVACRSWGDFRDIYEALYVAAQTANGVPFPYSTLIVDTADRWLALAEEEVIGRAREKYSAAVSAKIFTIGDIPEGNGWAQTTKLVMTALDKLDQLPCALVLIAHVKQVKVEEPTQKYDKETVSLWGGVGSNVLGWMKHTLHIQAMYVGDTLKRYIRTLPSKGLESKSHGGLVPDKTEWKTADLKAEWTTFRGLFE